MKLNILALVAIFGIASSAHANGGDGSNTPKNRLIICAMSGGSETGPKLMAEVAHAADPDAEIDIIYVDSSVGNDGGGTGGGCGSN